jgi:hypothetical protein
MAQPTGVPPALQTGLQGPQLINRISTRIARLLAALLLRLNGFFPTRLLQINFDLLFQNAGGQWRLWNLGRNATGHGAAAATSH